MNCIIDGYDFFNMEAMKYYSVPVGWSEEKKKENAMNKIFSGEWYGAQKRDGIFMLFGKDMDGNMYLRPRSRNTKKEFINKIDWVPHLHPFFESIPNGTVFLGELYLPRDEQAKTTTSIVNCLLPKSLKRQEKEEDKLHYYIFDILADRGESLINVEAIDRFCLLDDYSKKYQGQYSEWAHYCRGQELWDTLQQLLADGYEGMVITYENAKYEPGKRSSKVSLKIKKEIQDTIDCVIMGANPPTKIYSGKEIETWPYWFNEQTNTKILEGDFMKQVHHTIYQSYVEGAPVVPVTKNWFFGWAGSLKLGAMKDGQLIQVGNLSGITDEVKENWKDYIGKVCEISCMEIMTNQDGTQGLRHPKLIRIRDDKTKEECLWEDVFKS